jgi:phosphoribosylglycinamide formyltransferase-1
MFIKQVDNNEKETGITIHYVNEDYDEGGVVSKENNF